MCYGRTVRRALALLLMLLMLVETAGLAQAFGQDARVHCCCGPHAAARRCRCPSCPVKKRRFQGASLSAGGGCSDQVSSDGRLLVQAHLASPRLAVRVAAISEYPIEAARWSSRILESARPPP